MSKQLTFNQAKKKNFKTLEQYVPVVARVHGPSHPEFHEVKEIFDTIIKKSKEAGVVKPSLEEEFSRLGDITNNYKVPEDVCESYEAVYIMLEEVAQAYKA